MPDIEGPTSTLRNAIVNGLMIEAQVVRMERATAERVADRIMEGVERRDLTVVDRAKFAAWLGAVDSEIRPLLALRGKGQGICDVRGHHQMVFVPVPGWAWDVIVCEDCEAATQVEHDEEPSALLPD
jgi:hypothetical protein